MCLLKKHWLVQVALVSAQVASAPLCAAGTGRRHAVVDATGGSLTALRRRNRRGKTREGRFQIMVESHNHGLLCFVHSGDCTCPVCNVHGGSSSCSDRSFH